MVKKSYSVIFYVNSFLYHILHFDCIIIANSRIYRYYETVNVRATVPPKSSKKWYDNWYPFIKQRGLKVYILCKNCDTSIFLTSCPFTGQQKNGVSRLVTGADLRVVHRGFAPSPLLRWPAAFLSRFLEKKKKRQKKKHTRRCYPTCLAKSWIRPCARTVCADKNGKFC